jgi:hypothetical protein
LNLFNRAFTIIACLKLAAVAIAIVLLAWTMPQESIDGLRDAVDWLEEHNQDTEKALLTTIGSFVALLALTVVFLNLLPRSGTDVKVTDLKVGDAVLSTAAISQRIEEAVRQVPHVADVRAPVRAKRKGVLVTLDMYVDPDANLATVTDEACQAARDVLADRVHVALMQPPQVRLHYRELRLRGRPPEVSAVAPAPASPPVQPLVRQTVDPSVGHMAALPVEAPVAVADRGPEQAGPGAEGREGEHRE